MKPEFVRGLVQKKDKSGRKDGVWYVQRSVPEKLRPRFNGRRLLRVSLKTRDRSTAEARAIEIWNDWTAEIEAARRLGGGPLASLSEASAAIDDWRAAECLKAAGVEEAQPLPTGPLTGPYVVMAARMLTEPFVLDLTGRTGGGPPAIGQDVVMQAERFFADDPGRPREVATPFTVATLVGRLQMAVRDPEGWRAVKGLEEKLDGVLHAAAVPKAMLPGDRDEACRLFARAWLEVEQHGELQRWRHATVLEAARAMEAPPEAVRIAPAQNAYVPREDDRTVGELIEAFGRDRDARHGPQSTARKYTHIWTALQTALGNDKPVRAIGRDEARQVRDLLRTIPVHMAKRYPGASLREAIARAEEDGADLLAPNTVNSYLANLNAVFNWALREGDWGIERNPAAGLVDKDLPLLKRRGFTPDELHKIFCAAAHEREALPWRFWIPALGLWTGARLNELCQLRVEDVQLDAEVPHLVFSVFDRKGRRVEDKRLKTRQSARNVPLHPDLLNAGFADYVALVKGNARLFPQLKASADGSHSADASRWFGYFMDRIGLSDPALTFHGFRHGFRDECDMADISEAIVNALGGWSSTTQSAKYGNRGYLPVLLREVSKLSYGGFTLGRYVV